MVEKEITSNRKTNKHKSNPKGAKRIIQFAPYAFMGVELLLGIIALILVVNQALVWAGKVTLIIMVIAGLEYQWRRMAQGPSSFEDEFSTLSDILCFGVVPGLLIYQLAFRGWGVLGLVGVFAVVFGGMVRLSLYRIYNPVKARGPFIGLPLIINAAFISLVAQLVSKDVLIPGYRLILLAVVTLLAFLTVSPFRYPNPAEKPMLLAGILIAVLGLFFVAPINIWSSWFLLLSGLVYVLFGPLWAGKSKKAMA